MNQLEILKLIYNRIREMEHEISRLYVVTTKMYDYFARPVGVAMPAITELIKSKRKMKTATVPEYKERDWKMPYADWLIVLDSKAGDERNLREMTRSQIAELIASKHETSWIPPVSLFTFSFLHATNPNYNIIPEHRYK